MPKLGPDKVDWRTTYPDCCLHDDAGDVLTGPTTNPKGSVVALFLQPCKESVNALLLSHQTGMNNSAVEHAGAQRTLRHGRDQPQKKDDLQLIVERKPVLTVKKKLFANCRTLTTYGTTL